MKKKFSTFLKSLTTNPGVYQMIDKNGIVIYVGKAKNLKNRVTSYFSGQKDAKTLQMLSHVNKIEVTLTNNEQDAYILENSLIKELKPKYNIVFRDDKSYPFIKVVKEDNKDFPSLVFFRGFDPKQKSQKSQKTIKSQKSQKTIKSQKGKTSTKSTKEEKKLETSKNFKKSKDKDILYGPYPNIQSVKETIDILQRTFKLRNCNKTTYNNRTRPCLQYQIKRCSAPCVNYISCKEYQEDVKNAEMFLTGKAKDLIINLAHKMEKASENMEFEKAAKIRDQIASIKNIQKQQIIISPNSSINLDVIALDTKFNLSCFHLLSIRLGKIIGSKQYFLHEDDLLEKEPENIFIAFIMQHYLYFGFSNLDYSSSQNLPDEILVSSPLANKSIIEQLLSKELDKKIKISHKVKSMRLKWLKMAKVNAHSALKSELANQVDYSLWFNDLMKSLKYDFSSIACVDVSHTHGMDTVGAIVVFNENGPVKSNYRRFNIKTTSKGDDYQAIREVLDRYISKMQKLKQQLPDVMIIDGGKGQLKVAEEILEKYSVINVKLLAIAKGPLRKSGTENIFVNSKGDMLDIEGHLLAFLLLQHVRDEAHRFAITGHRRKNLRRFKYSTLEDIPGIGAKRRKILLCHFGGMQEIMQASIEELSLVPGINRNLAEKIYNVLHGV